MLVNFTSTNDAKKLDLQAQFDDLKAKLESSQAHICLKTKTKYNWTENNMTHIRIETSKQLRYNFKKCLTKKWRKQFIFLEKSGWKNYKPTSRMMFINDRTFMNELLWHSLTTFYENRWPSGNYSWKKLRPKNFQKSQRFQKTSLVSKTVHFQCDYFF